LLGSGFKGGRSRSSAFPNYPRPQLPAPHFSQLEISTDWAQVKVKVRVKIMIWPVNQSVLVSKPHLGPKTRFLLLPDNCEFVDARRPLWREDYLSFTIVAVTPGPVLRDSWQYFTVLDLRLGQPGRPGHHDYISQEHGGWVPPVTGYGASSCTRLHPGKPHDATDHLVLVIAPKCAVRK
jgi:hypothetical protein